MTSRLCLAVIISIAVAPLIILIDFAADRVEWCAVGLRAFIDAMGLLMGLTWESAFDRAVEALEERLAPGGTERQTLCAKVMFLAVISIVCLPAWRLYILTRAHDGVEAAEKAEATPGISTETEKRGSKLFPLPDKQRTSVAGSSPPCE